MGPCIKQFYKDNSKDKEVALEVFEVSLEEFESRARDRRMYDVAEFCKGQEFEDAGYIFDMEELYVKKNKMMMMVVEQGCESRIKLNSFTIHHIIFTIKYSLFRATIASPPTHRQQGRLQKYTPHIQWDNMAQTQGDQAPLAWLVWLYNQNRHNSCDTSQSKDK